MNFYAASQFFDVLKLFGELSPDVVEKQKYAKWKAANINSCLKKGITPKPGPPTQENDQQPNSPQPSHTPQTPDTNSQFQTFPSIPTVPAVPTMPTPPIFDIQPGHTLQQSNTTVTPTISNLPTNLAPTTRQTPPQTAAPIVQPSSGSFTPSYQDVELATKHAKFAVSSLQFEDVPSAVKFLKLALKNLTNVEN
mmetsp:Transcript_27799/g.39170  ORF Transcript_27799/g.39170 Transcript_27799/m.39170 type:complete len:194 (-) Transcript_27799:77-658(-)